MSLNLDKTSWKRVTLGDVVRHVTDRVDPETSGLGRFLAGEHIPSGSLAITKWGVIGRDPVGPMFYKRFKPGHVLYVSRRTYLRKVAVPEFEGITGEKTFVLESRDPDQLLQEFLPYILSAEAFHCYAITNSRGSVNPYLNWGELAAYEFELPSHADQQRLANLLWAVELHLNAHVGRRRAIARLSGEALTAVATRVPTVPLRAWVARIEAGRSPRAAGEPAVDGEFGVLKVSAVGRNGFVSTENKRLLDASAFRPGDRVRRGDLLVTRANAVVDNVARPCVVDRDFPNLMLSDKTLRIVPAPGYPNRVVLAALQSAAYRAHVREAVNGTGAKNISQQGILDGPVPDLNSDAVERLLVRLTSLDEASAAAESELGALKTLKVSILSDIFGGR